jgi:hypothetical protein
MNSDFESSFPRKLIFSFGNWPKRSQFSQRGAEVLF